GIDDASYDAFCGNLLAQDSSAVDGLQAAALEFTAMPLEIPIRNAVLHRYDGGVVVEELRDLICDCRQLIGLGRQDDQVLRPGLIVVVGRGNAVGKILVAVREA